MESFLLKAIKGEDVQKEVEFLNENYGDCDVDINFLDTEIQILKTIFASDPTPCCFKDIRIKFESLSDGKKRMIPIIISIFQLMRDHFLSQDMSNLG